MSPAPAPAAKCRYHGKSHAALRLTGRLTGQNGNECAVVFDSFAPCKMEALLGRAPDETVCPIAKNYQRFIQIVMPEGGLIHVTDVEA